MTHGSYYRRKGGKYHPLDRGPADAPIYFQYYIQGHRIRICCYTADEAEARRRINRFGLGQLPLDNHDLYLYALAAIGDKARAELSKRLTTRRKPATHRPTRGTQTP
jgi:hypothetical protein